MTEFLTPLPLDALRDLGIPEPWTYGRADRVRFYELDALGHVNNTAYLRWFETVRVGWFSDYGLSDYGPDAPTFVLRAISCEFHAPMFLNDTYVVSARASGYRNTSFTKEYAVWANGTLMVSGSAVVVMTDKAGTTKIPLTKAMTDVLVERDGAIDER